MMETPYENEPRQVTALPNATLVLVMGILSILFSCCFSPVGVVLAIIGLIFNSKDQKLYEANPNAYQRSSYNNLQAGRIMSIVGLILSVLLTIVSIYWFIVNGSMIWSETMKQMEGMRGE